MFGYTNTICTYVCICMYDTYIYTHSVYICIYSEYEFNLARKITYIYILG